MKVYQDEQFTPQSEVRLFFTISFEVLAVKAWRHKSTANYAPLFTMLNLVSTSPELEDSFSITDLMRLSSTPSSFAPYHFKNDSFQVTERTPIKLNTPVYVSLDLDRPFEWPQIVLSLRSCFATDSPQSADLSDNYHSLISGM